MFCYRSHGRNKKHRVIDWYLHCLLERSVCSAFVVVVKTDYVSKKNSVQTALLSNTR